MLKEDIKTIEKNKLTSCFYKESKVTFIGKMLAIFAVTIFIYGIYGVVGAREERLSSKTREVFNKITADSLSSTGRIFSPKEVKIIYDKSNNPFPDTPKSKIDNAIGKDVGLEISVKKIDQSGIKSLKIAKEALLAGQAESAMAYYKRVLSGDPENRHALFGLASAYHLNNQIDQARDIYVKLIMADQSNWKAMNNFLILASQEAPEEALKQLKELELSNSEFAPLHAQIGVLLVKQGKLKDAIGYLTQAAILEPNNMNYRYSLAVAMDHLGNKNAAIKLYIQILSANNKSGILSTELGKIKNRLNFLLLDTPDNKRG